MDFMRTERAAWRRMRRGERLALRLYGLVMRLLPAWAVIGILRRRAARNPGREPPDRVPERMGLGQPARPDGPVIWFHGIGPGDATMHLPLIRAALGRDGTATCLVTTRTAAGQKVFARLGEPTRVITVLAPLDTPAAMRRFLDHWRPKLAVHGELDIWPHALTELKRRGVPIALVNAQMNGRLGRAFQRQPGLARWMATHVDYLHLFTDAEAAEARPWFRPDCIIAVERNLKMDAPALPVSDTIMAGVRAAWQDAPVLTCASIAHHEVKPLIEAARQLGPDLPDLRLILVPRWAEDGDAFADLLRAQGTGFSRRAPGGGLPRAQDRVFIADSYGEMGSWIALSFAVFMGHTLNGGIGHNPFEPIAQRRPILSGSIPTLLHADYRYLADLGLCHVAPDAPAIASRALALWQARDQDNAAFARIAAARGFAARMMDDMLALCAPHPRSSAGAEVGARTGEGAIPLAGPSALR